MKSVFLHNKHGHLNTDTNRGTVYFVLSERFTALTSLQVSSPFQLAASLSETEYEDYGLVLQKLLLDVLGDPPTLGGF